MMNGFWEFTSHRSWRLPAMLKASAGAKVILGFVSGYGEAEVGRGKSLPGPATLVGFA